MESNLVLGFDLTYDYVSRYGFTRVDRLTISRQLEPTIWELRGCELLVDDAVCILFHDLLASIIVYHRYV